MYITIKRNWLLLFVVPLLVLFSLYGVSHAKVVTRNSLSLIGAPAYSDDFKHFEYVNPDAPKGGMLKLAAIGSYDTLNPYNAKGLPAEGLHMVHARLMMRSVDEPYALYPVVAKNIQYPDDLSWVAFDLNPLARFHDGVRITAADIVFTFGLLKDSGSPFIKNNYRNVLRVRAEGEHRVVFELSRGQGIKLLAFVAFTPVLAKHFWKNRSFDAGLTQLPVGSGPMRVSHIKMGQSISYERIKDYWGADLPTHKGQYNFDTIRIDYYRDSHASMEAFCAGVYDFRYELDAKAWHQNYQFPAAKRKEVVVETVPFSHPPGMKAFVFNTRKPLFKERQVRSALLGLFDFEWINKHLLHSGFQRTASFFTNTPLRAEGVPSKQELKFLQPFRKELPVELFVQAPVLPVSNGTGSNRDGMYQAIQKLNSVGWVLEKGIMLDKKTGNPFVFNLLLNSQDDARVVMSFKKSLADIGIKMNIQTLDLSQYRKRVKDFDFDMTSWHFIHSPFPGSEQANSWSSMAASEPRSNNLAGVSSPVIDMLVERIREAAHYQDVIDAVRALDRTLLWGCYVIPKWHNRHIHMAYWKHLKRPHTGNPHYPVLETMWHVEATQ